MCGMGTPCPGIALRIIPIADVWCSMKGIVAELVDTSIPKFADGCRWGGTTEAPVVLCSEGTVRVEGTGRIILELCDGHFSLAEIVQKLETQFILAPQGKIRADVQTFLEQLHAQHIIEY